MNAKSDALEIVNQLLDAIRDVQPEHLTAEDRDRLIDALLAPVVALNRVLEEPGGFALLRTFTRAHLQLLLVYGSAAVRAECRRRLAEGSGDGVH